MIGGMPRLERFQVHSNKEPRFMGAHNETNTN